MIASKEVRLGILRYLRDVYKESPVKVVRGSEIMNTFNIDEDSLKGTLKFLKDVNLIFLMNSDYGTGALVRITQKGLGEIENLSG